jgi:hypothetical protein
MKELNNYYKSCIELADTFLEKYFDCKTEYTDPNSYAYFIGNIGNILDAGSDIAFFNMNDIVQILTINPEEKESPYLFCLHNLDNKKPVHFKYWYMNIYKKTLTKDKK